jgi:hypothetical protein
MNLIVAKSIINHLEELGLGLITTEECLNCIFQILSNQIESFGVVKNTHNYAQIVFECLDEIDLYYQCRALKKSRKTINFTEDNNPEEMEHSIFRACSALLFMLENRKYEPKVTTASTQLKEYIEKMNLYSTEDYIE